MIRAAIFASVLLAAPAVAAPAFQAQPEATPTTARFALRDTLWKCDETGCVAAASNSRPAVVCAVLAKEVGPLRSFTFNGEALSPDALGKCNARARNVAPEQVRTAARP